MRPLLVGALALNAIAAVAPRSLAAQVTASSEAAAPTDPRWQTTLVFVGQSALVRASLLQGTPPPERTVALRGIDLSIRPRQFGIGVHARLAQSSLGAADLSVAEIGATLGVPAFSLEATFAQRAGYSPNTGLMHDESYPYVRAGLRFQRMLGTSRFSVFFRGAALFGTDASLVEPVEGWDGETQVAWTARRIPLRAMLGYRLERFAVAGVEQEVSALLFGVGVVRGMPR